MNNSKLDLTSTGYLLHHWFWKINSFLFLSLQFSHRSSKHFITLGDKVLVNTKWTNFIYMFNLIAAIKRSCINFDGLQMPSCRPWQYFGWMYSSGEFVLVWNFKITELSDPSNYLNIMTFPLLIVCPVYVQQYVKVWATSPVPVSSLD